MSMLPMPLAPRPILACLTAAAGPPETVLFEAEGTAVMSVPGRYSVTYLVLGPDAVGVADVGSTADVPGILAALDWLGRPRSQVRWVMPTHLHFDHILGVDLLACTLGVPVLLGETSAEVASGRRVPRWPRGIHLLRAAPTWLWQGLPFPPRPDWERVREFGVPWGHNRFRAPVVTITGATAPLDGFPGWTMLATPGHSDDAVCLHHETAGFLVAGDTVRNFLGGEWNPLLSDAGEYAGTRDLLTSLHVDVVFPAHGPVLRGVDVLGRVRSLPWWMP